MTRKYLRKKKNIYLAVAIKDRNNNVHKYNSHNEYSLIFIFSIMFEYNINYYLKK